MQKFFLFLTVLAFPFTAFCQISGTVLTAKDSVPVQGVSVYFDGTSIGTVTNAQGNFKLEEMSQTAPLIISFLGYENLILPQLQKGQKLGALLLYEQAEQLKEVLLEPDTWSREKKLQHFKREFLGNTPEALKCRIKNTEVLELHYNPSKQALTAYAREPLQIINRHLGYEITYDLTSFKIQYSIGSSGLSLVHSVFYEGTSFFQDLKKNPRKKHLWNRKNSYLGSSLHFMRSLASRQLEENQFHIYHKSFRTDPYQHFDMGIEGNVTTVEMTAEKLSILYAGIEQSEFQPISAFRIDGMGNHTPPLAVIFGGVMAAQRLAHLLPLDYKPE